MLEVITSNKTNEEFGCVEGTCVVCGELALFSKDVFDRKVWLHKVDRGNGYFGFDTTCPKSDTPKK